MSICTMNYLYYECMQHVINLRIIKQSILKKKKILKYIFNRNIRKLNYKEYYCYFTRLNAIIGTV